MIVYTVYARVRVTMRYCVLTYIIFLFSLLSLQTIVTKKLHICKADRDKRIDKKTRVTQETITARAICVNV